MPRALIAITGAFRTGGGIAAVNRLVLHALADLGYEIDTLVLNEYYEDAVRVIPINLQKSYLQYNESKLKFALAVWQLVLRKSYDLIIVDHVNLASILAPLSRFNLCKYVVWLFGAELFPPRPDWQGRLGMRFASKCLAISEYTRLRAKEIFPTQEMITVELALDQTHSVSTELSGRETGSNPIFLRAIDGSSKELSDRVILHVGRMESAERYKGQDRLIEAFPHFAFEHPSCQIVLAGDGSDADRLRAIARQLSPELQGRIFMPGLVSTDLLDQLYKACYLFAMPSTGEGFGLVYLEAMARAKPCIGGKLDAAKFVIRDGVTGVLVDDPRSPAQIAEKIIELLNEPQRASQMGKAGYELVRSYYMFPHFKERFRIALEV